MALNTNAMKHRHSLLVRPLLLLVILAGIVADARVPQPMAASHQIVGGTTGELTGASWTSCGEGQITIESITVTPDPIITGQDGTFSIYGTNNGESVPSGSLKVKVGTKIIHLVSVTLDLCEETKCPVQPGGVQVVTKQPFPGFIPPATFTAEVQGEADDGTLLFCVDLTFQTTGPTNPDLLGRAEEMFHKIIEE